MYIIIFLIFTAAYLFACILMAKLYFLTASYFQNYNQNRILHFIIANTLYVLFLAIEIPLSLYSPFWLIQTFFDIKYTFMAIISIAIFGCSVLGFSLWYSRRVHLKNHPDFK